MHRWEKKGLIFAAEKTREWMVSHASVPTAFVRQNGELRIIFGTRDSANRSYSGFVDLDPFDPSRVIKVSEQPVLGPGVMGAFDDCGAMPSWITVVGNRLYLYYIGWN